MIIEQLLELLLCTGRLRIFLFSSQKSSYRPLLPLLYYLIFWDTLPYIYQIYSRLSDRSTFRNDEVSAILLQKWVSATVAEFESHLPNAVTPSSKPRPQGTFGLVAQWLRSHSPMKCLGSSLESSVSLLGAIQGHNYNYRTFRTFSKVLLLLTQYCGSHCSCGV